MAGELFLDLKKRARKDDVKRIYKGVPMKTIIVKKKNHGKDEISRKWSDTLNMMLDDVFV